jgi:FSR family fosmidomycin resistance protein-like MFS transporter
MFSFILAALAVEFVDELVDGTKGAAVPLIRTGLSLSYTQIGLLFSLPLIVGSVIELPLGIMAGYGRRRRSVVMLGGATFSAAILAMAGAQSFAVLLLAFVVFYPASGAFVSLTEAELMDGQPDRRESNMAAWVIAGSAGALAGPALVGASLAIGGGWRWPFVVAAAASTVALAWLVRRPSPSASDDRSTSAADLALALRETAAMRWLLLQQVANLLLDVLTGFVALSIVTVDHAGPGWAAAAVAIRLACGLAGEALVLGWLRSRPGTPILIAGTAVACVAYPAFLWVPGLAAKLVALGLLSLATAPWWPILQARLFDELHEQSAVAVTLQSAAGLIGGAGPLAVGLVAGHTGLGPALAMLVVVPPVMLVGLLGGGAVVDLGPDGPMTAA